LCDTNKASNNIFILLDEIENSLHPRWQKKIISALILFLEMYEINIHIIISTHSPYILSDLPKENVIFLEKYTEKEIAYNHLDQKVGNCKNVTKDIKINPFGANIHTLLSHGFFMKDGLMGEFAKGKIQNVINFINDKESDLKKEEIYPIIELIGEPFLKQKLKEQYFTKFPEERDLDDEISILEKKLTELKNVKNSKQ